jgi:hypothetical protein
MKTQKWKTMVTTALTVVLSASAATAAEERKDGMRFIPDVIEAFGALSEAPETLGFHITTTPDPSFCKHYQAIVRVNGADGTPFFLVTKSGNNPAYTGDGLFCDDSPGETGDGKLTVFRMDSRNKTGERMRSNRLQKGKHINSSAPPVEDRATIFFTVTEDGLVFRDGEGGHPPKTYRHPGGMQVVGNMMVMAMEARRDPKGDCLKLCALVPSPGCEDLCNQIQYPAASWPTMVQFYDVSDPEDPKHRSNFKPTNEHGEPLTGCDGIAVTPLPNDRYLLAVTGGFDTEDPIYFYRSRSLGDCSKPEVDCTLANPNLEWDFVAKRNAPDTKDPIQALHFIREGNIAGTLYLAGSNGHPICPSGDCDRINLFTVNSQSPNFEPGEEVTFTVNYRGKRVYTHPSTGGAQIANLAAAAGFYESPSGELIFYATEHDNDGPSETVKAGEWRYESVVRGDSPTYLPNLVLDTTQEVNEGGDLTLTGAAGPPITKAWIQVYGFFGSFIVDYDDEGLDDYAALRQFEPSLFLQNGWADQPLAWHWFAPLGCSIRAKDALDDDFDPRSEPRVATVAGTGNYETQTMEDVLDDVNGEEMLWTVDGVGYVSNCDDYYGGPWKVFWDMERDGSYVGQGDSISFDAFELDGPDTVTIPVQSRHATTTGPVGQSAVTITIKNVAPIVAPLVLTDPAGRTIGSTVPFILTNLPVTVATSFTDPGLADTQTAELAWGDATVDLDGVFEEFTQATGGEFGAVGHTHRYLTPGSYTPTLDVEDDDHGVGTVSSSLLVVSPEQAILDMIARIDVLLAGTADRTSKKYLTAGRRALTGTNPPRTSDGALPQLRAGNEEAAAAFVGVAANWLESAATGGVNVSVLLAIAEQLILGLSAL